jgi:hypothetical protein
MSLAKPQGFVRQFTDADKPLGRLIREYVEQENREHLMYLSTQLMQ